MPVANASKEKWRRRWEGRAKGERECARGIGQEKQNGGSGEEECRQIKRQRLRKLSMQSGGGKNEKQIRRKFLSSIG